MIIIRFKIQEKKIKHKDFDNIFKYFKNEDQLIKDSQGNNVSDLNIFEKCYLLKD